jgi:hypothetical protein
MGYVYFFIDWLDYTGSLESMNVGFGKSKQNNSFNIKCKMKYKI